MFDRKFIARTTLKADAKTARAILAREKLGAYLLHQRDGPDFRFSWQARDDHRCGDFEQAVVILSDELLGNVSRGQKESHSDLSFDRTRLLASKSQLTRQDANGIHPLEQLFPVQLFAHSGQVRSVNEQAKAH